MGHVPPQGQNEVKNSYHQIMETIKRRLPKATSPKAVRKLAIMSGQATFLYDFGQGNEFSVGPGKFLGETLHEMTIKKLWMAYEFGMWGPSPTEKEKIFKRWLETGRHERWCHYRDKYSSATFHEPSMTCDKVKKRLKKWECTSLVIK